MRKGNEAVSGEVQIGHQEKVLHWEGGQSLEQAPQGSSDSTKPVRVQGASGRCSSSCGLVIGTPMRSKELDSVSLIGALQLEIFYGSMILSNVLTFSLNLPFSKPNLSNPAVFIHP